ncbi:hypothetical protein KY338_01985 [Candidatus Woesearchaeota archaeon]|nr:hypothetical protein [Candidatus Woesearchaeota archaeon]MBW3005953.1 hypothetical protein [Candidatus Woesearchaeota archaeon]
MNKTKIIVEIICIILSVFFISFAIENNIGGLFGVSVAGAIIFWSVVRIWKEITDGKKLYLTRKNRKFQIQRK